MTKLGLELRQVLFIGRWGSQTVGRYVAEAAADRPSELDAVSNCFAEKAVGEGAWGCDKRERAMRGEAEEAPIAWWVVRDELASFKCDVADVRVLRNELSQSMFTLRGDWRNSLRRLGDLELRALAQEVGESRHPGSIPAGRAKFVVNLDSGTCRLIFLDGPVLRPDSWKAACGWKFGCALSTAEQSGLKVQIAANASPRCCAIVLTKLNSHVQVRMSLRLRIDVVGRWGDLTQPSSDGEILLFISCVWWFG
jgi:hypothetical protein